MVAATQQSVQSVPDCQSGPSFEADILPPVTHGSPPFSNRPSAAVSPLFHGGKQPEMEPSAWTGLGQAHSPEPPSDMVLSEYASHWSSCASSPRNATVTHPLPPLPTQPLAPTPIQPSHPPPHALPPAHPVPTPPSQAVQGQQVVVGVNHFSFDHQHLVRETLPRRSAPQCTLRLVCTRCRPAMPRIRTNTAGRRKPSCPKRGLSRAQRPGAMRLLGANHNLAMYGNVPTYASTQAGTTLVPIPSGRLVRYCPREDACHDRTIGVCVLIHGRADPQQKKRFTESKCDESKFWGYHCVSGQFDRHLRPG